MSDRNIWWKLLATAVLAALAFWEMYPPAKRLKGGIDLVGGHSLLYEIDDTGLDADQKKDLAKRVMRVLQRRVDPNNVRNLIWRPIGHNRLEIQMPRPPREATERREAYRQAEARLKATNLRPRQVEQALQLPPQQRARALEQLLLGVPARRALLQKLARAYDQMQQALAGDDEQAKLEATDAYDAAMDQLLATNVDLARLAAIASLGANSALRQKQLSEFKSTYPARAELIDKAITAYDRWAEVKGPLDDPADLQRLLRGAGVLEFRILAEPDPQNPAKYDSYRQQLARYGPRVRAGQRYGWFPIEKPLSFLKLKRLQDFQRVKANLSCIAEKYGDKYYVLAHLSPDKGLLATGRVKWSLKSAMPRPDPERGGYLVDFVLDERGGSLFETLTRQNLKKRLCILLDGVAISAPTIQSAIRTHGQITGDFTDEDVKYLAQTLNAGALPARLKPTPISVKSIGPSLGRTNRQMGTRAAMWGAIAVLVFMAGYYLTSGLVTDLAVAMNLLLVLGLMAAMDATFTLPGIAGLALTVGMAVDANVLINERIREELSRGVSLRLAIKTGYEKAFSAILDSNVTTIMTCVILGYFGSEEVKGFALTLGLGLVCNVFTAVFMTRWVVTALVQMGIVRSLPMLRIIGAPKIDWMAKKRLFQSVSLVLPIVGLAIFVARDNSKLFDIEFLGGVSAQIELKDGITMTDAQVRQKVNQQASGWLAQAANALASAQISPASSSTGQFLVRSSALTASQLEDFVLAVMEDQIVKGGIEEVGTHAIRITTKPRQRTVPNPDQNQPTRVQYPDLAAIQRLINQAAATYARDAGHKLATASVQIVQESGRSSPAGQTFEIITTETNKKIVRDAILAVMADQLNIQGQVSFSLRTRPAVAPDGMFPIEQRRLAQVIGDPAAPGDVRDYLGGVAFVLDQLDPPQSEQQVRRRLRDMRLQPDFEQYAWRDFTVIGLKPTANNDSSAPLFTSLAIVVADPNFRYDEDPVAWRDKLARPELELLRSALHSERSLQKVTQFAPQVATQARNEAALAMVLALIAIVLYIWVRFGTLRHGLAAIIALVHDVSITLGLVSASYFVAQTPVGKLLEIQDFKINLAMVAAFLTLIGYSLNDTIIVFDRIRENRGKLTAISPPLVNTSINQTLSRTLLTSLTTLCVVGILYVAGGRGIHGISFALMVGTIVGTYSSIGVASPLLLARVRRTAAAARPARPVAAGSG